MKVQKYYGPAVVIILLAAFILSVSMAAAQGAEKVTVVIHEYLVESGEGEATFPGGNLHLRGLTHETIEASENACVDGLGFIDYKVNLNKNGHVYAGGAWVIEPLAYVNEGVWEMNWHLTDDKPIVAVGQGTGILNGMSIKLTHTGDGADDDGEYMIFTGEILVPPHAQVECAE